MRPKVSIVVPMYNVERYLRPCVDSLLGQTLQDIEILLVDDGSPDRCGAIADEYAVKDPRVNVFHQENAGLGPARNTGIEHARGEYVGFVDSDDWVDTEMFANLYTAATQHDADIVVGGHRDMVNGHVRITKRHPLANTVLSGSDEIMPVRNKLFGHSLEDTTVESFPMRVWTTIYRNSMLQDKRLRFEEILSEDTIFNLSAYREASIIVFTDNTNYCYRMDNQPSIMRSFSPDKLIRYETFITRLWQLAEQEQIDHDECLIRVKRTAIDYCRLYAGLVVDGNVSIPSKLRYLHQLTDSELCVRYSASYPLKKLPRQQRMFHQALLHGREWEVLLLMQARQVLKKKVWK
ncbi:glycosyltransferase [Bifidobacterium oedipodis]|uniref:Glycosyl transferase n=1 Tax=Bifidobacterium oedipodis TaxID=2675322 RepID=A0A7Y0ETT2_9BIFI|nr:glycosyltransferase [Bifidobacterium sp. DSM 109957]NMM95231.1 glycosyl transferase [Bifidobacterium sp. DSM 109957]